MTSIVVLGVIFYVLIQQGQWTAMYLAATIGCAIFFVIVALDLGIKAPESKGSNNRSPDE